MQKIFKKLLLPTLLLSLVLATSGVYPERAYAADPVTGKCTYQAVNKTTGAKRIWSIDAVLETGCRVGSKQDTPTETITVVNFSPTGSQKADQTFDSDSPGFWDLIFKNLFMGIGTILLQITGLLVGLAGAILNGVIYHTIYNVAENYNNLDPLLETWKVLRDLANMSFIFVLLYAGIKTMLGQAGSDTKKVITGVVIAAVLLNFSLFFTRLVIDVANVIALTFYTAISPETTTSGFLSWGLSNAFMQHLGLQSFFNLSQDATINSDTVITVGVMGSVMLLVAAFSFLAIAVLFIIRYVVLMLVMILSPIYFVSFALPKDAGIEKYAKQWKDALFGQAFFAPVYFLLVWISLRILEGIFKVLQAGDPTSPAFTGALAGKAPDAGALTMFINFAIVIALLLASLTTAKKMADSAGSGMGKITSWATGKAGAMTFGAAGGLGRGTVGRAGQALGENDWLKNKAATSNFVGKFAARQALGGGRKVGAASFDARGAGLGGKEAGKAGGKGGFAKYREEQVKEEEKFAKSLGASDTAIAKANANVKTAEAINIESPEFKKDYENVRKNQEQKLDQKRKEMADAGRRYNEFASQANSDFPSDVAKLNKLKEESEKAKKEYGEVEKMKFSTPKEYKDIQVAAAKAEVDRLKGVDEKEARKRLKEQGITKPNKEQVEAAKVASVGDDRKKKFADSVENSWLAWSKGYNYNAAAQIRKGKSKEKQLAEAYKKIVDDEPKDDEPDTEAPETPPAAPPSNPAP